MSSVVIKQEQVVVQVVLYPVLAIPTFTPFGLVATTNNQTVFTLPGIPTSMLVVAVNGIVQSSVAGDFTVVGNQLTLSSGVDQNTLIAGIYV